MALLGAIAWWSVHWLQPPAVRLPGSTAIAVVLAVAGLALNLAPKLRFGRAGTTVNPMRPDTASALVTTGPYRWSRNPMYLGHAVLLLAWAAWLRQPLALAAVPGYLAYVTAFQILPEERALAARFGQAYLDYRRRVRRWL